MTGRALVAQVAPWDNVPIDLRPARDGMLTAVSAANVPERSQMTVAWDVSGPGVGVPVDCGARDRAISGRTAGGRRPSVDNHDPARINSRPATAPVPGRSPSTATPSANATTGLM